MPRSVSYLRLIIAAFMFATLPAIPAIGQQTVTMSFTVPFTLRNLHPDITHVFVRCLIGFAPSFPPGQPSTIGLSQSGAVQVPESPVAALTRAADGSYSGTATDAVRVTVPPDTGGKSGGYRCVMWGRLTPLAVGQFGRFGELPVFNTTGSHWVDGVFTW